MFYFADVKLWHSHIVNTKLTRGYYSSYLMAQVTKIAGCFAGPSSDHCLLFIHYVFTRRSSIDAL